MQLRQEQEDRIYELIEFGIKFEYPTVRHASAGNGEPVGSTET